MMKRLTFGFSFTVSAAILGLLGCFLMTAFPGEALSGAREGLRLWADSVLPAQLPFFIAVNFLSRLGIPALFGRFFEPAFRRIFRVPGEGAFCFVSSVLSGYPLGTKLAADARKQGTVTKNEGETILAFSSTSGPLFLLGTVGSGLLGNPYLGMTIALCHYTGALLNGLLWREKGKLTRYPKRREDRAQTANFPGLLPVLTEVILSSVQSVILIGCYVMLFSMAVRCIPGNGGFSLWCKGLLEMTVGCAAAANGEDPLTAAVLCCFFVSFGGLSVFLQSCSFLGGTDLSKGKFFLQKLTQGILSAGLAVLWLRFGPSAFLKAFSRGNALPGSLDAAETFLPGVTQGLVPGAGEWTAPVLSRWIFSGKLLLLLLLLYALVALWDVFARKLTGKVPWAIIGKQRTKGEAGIHETGPGHHSGIQSLPQRTSVPSGRIQAALRRRTGRSRHER